MSLVREVLERAKTAHTPPLLAFVTDSASKQAIEQLAADLAMEASVVRGGCDEAIARLTNARSPRILLVDLTGTEFPLTNVEELANVCDPSVQMIAVGDRNDVGLYRDLIARGVADYLVKPISSTLIQASLSRLMAGSDEQGRHQAKQGRLIAVVGARGGVGCTTLAGSLAWTLAEVRRRRTMLIDLDPHFGTVALNFDQEPSRGFRDALEDSVNVDSLVIERIMASISDKLSIIAAEDDLDWTPRTDLPGLRPLVSNIRQSHHFVIVDIAHRCLQQGLELVDEVTDLILVSHLTVASLRDTVRLLALCTKSSPSVNVSVVANAVGAHRNGELSRQEFENGLGRALTAVVPFDGKNVLGAANAGKPVPLASVKVRTAISELAAGLCGSGRPAARSPLSRLFRRGR